MYLGKDINTYTYTDLKNLQNQTCSLTTDSPPRSSSVSQPKTTKEWKTIYKILPSPILNGVWLGLHKILFHFAAFMWDSILPSLPPPTCIARTIAILLHVYCARYDAPPTPPLYAIHYTILVMAISCKGQCMACKGGVRGESRVRGLTRGAWIAQWSCKSNAIGLALQVRGGNKRMIDSNNKALK